MFKIIILILALLALSASAFRMRSIFDISRFNFSPAQIEMYNNSKKACQESLCPQDNGNCYSSAVHSCTVLASIASKFIIIIEIENHLLSLSYLS